jgi:CheY-like chemotaxis protein
VALQGIGLFLCKNLIELMDGDIYLDEEYNTGLKDRPGSRFIVDLKQPPFDGGRDLTPYISSGHGLSIHGDGSDSDSSARYTTIDLPKRINVLFVDDDAILRKLFARTIRTIAPDWNIREASNGETALKLVEDHHFDLIFMDMYMASVTKQMLGTESVAALRAAGVKCRICGLSANDKASEFLAAGADAFTFKPLQFEKSALQRELCRILYS